MCGGYSLVRKRTFTQILRRCGDACVKRRVWRKHGASYGRVRLSWLALHLHQQHRHVYLMSHFVRSRAIQNVTDQAVTVGCHRDRKSVFFPRELDDLIRWLTQCEDGFAGKSFMA